MWRRCDCDREYHEHKSVWREYRHPWEYLHGNSERDGDAGRQRFKHNRRCELNQRRHGRDQQHGDHDRGGPAIDHQSLWNGDDSVEWYDFAYLYNPESQYLGNSERDCLYG